MKNLKKSTTTLTSHQKEIFDQIINEIVKNNTSILKTTDIADYLLSLFGPAGTGKSYMTTQIVKYFLTNNDILDDGICVTAPTHKAVSVLARMFEKQNIQVSATTIHAFLGIKPFIDYKTGEEKFVIDRTIKKKPTKSLLIVDESSMISNNLFQYIIEAIEENRVNTVLFIGDPYQLLPIDKSKNEIFDLKKQYRLDKIVRQAKDSYIIDVATKLRKRIEDKNFINLKDFFKENQYKELKFFHNKNAFLGDFYKNKDWHKEDKILASYTNKSVDAFNREIRAKFWQERNNPNPPALLSGDMLRFNDAYSVNDITLYHNGQEVTLESAKLQYQESLEIEYWDCKAVNKTDQQIFRVVDPSSMSQFNKKLNFIRSLAKREVYHPKKRELWKSFYATRDMFANVQYIFSSTIHKLQGSTHDVSYIDLFSLADNRNLSDEEKYRLVYVAITRASKDVKIFISHLSGKENEIDNLNIDATKIHQQTDFKLANIFKDYKKLLKT